MQLKGQRGPRLSSETERQKSKQRTNMLLVPVTLYSTLGLKETFFWTIPWQEATKQ